jgi:hypothetical protein
MMFYDLFSDIYVICIQCSIIDLVMFYSVFSDVQLAYL